MAKPAKFVEVPGYSGTSILGSVYGGYVLEPVYRYLIDSLVVPSEDRIQKWLYQAL